MERNAACKPGNSVLYGGTSKLLSTSVSQGILDILKHRKVAPKNKPLWCVSFLLRQAEQGPVGSIHTISHGEWRWPGRIQARAGWPVLSDESIQEIEKEPTKNVLVRRGLLTSTAVGYGRVQVPRNDLVGKTFPGCS